MKALSIGYAIALCGDDTYINGYRTPPRRMAIENFGELMIAVQRRNSLQECTVLIDRAQAVRMGIPAKLPRSDKMVREHESLQSARADGWRIKELRPWMTFWKPGAKSVHIGLLQWSDAVSFAPYDLSDPGWMTRILATYHDLMGLPYRMTSGVTAMAMIRDIPPRIRRERDMPVNPLWQPDWSDIEPAQFMTELPFGWISQRTDHLGTGSYEHGYDVNLQFLAGMNGADLPFDHLTWRGGDQFDGRPGWWKFTVPAWNEPRLPHPVGGDAQPGDVVWRTTPRVNLLVELAQRYGIMEYPTFHESWTCERHGRLLRPFAEKIRDAITESAYHDVRSAPIISRMARATYKEGWGMLASEGSRVRRHDWHQITAALAHSNQWRRMWQAALKGRWPVEVDKDTVWYRSEDPDPVSAKPESIPLGTNLGTWKVVGTRERTLA